MEIRPATKSDLPVIIELVYELAQFENEPSAITATQRDYEKGFQTVFEVIVAEEAGQVIGMALYYMTWSTWKGKMFYLEDFVVKKDHRNAGVGQKLFDHAVAIAKEQECTIMKWQVLDWNTDAIRFYKRNQAVMEKGWLNAKIIF